MFSWQYSHFYGILWMSRADYENAGFKVFYYFQNIILSKLKKNLLDDIRPKACYSSFKIGISCKSYKFNNSLFKFIDKYILFI
jgi:hypothetical protein